MTISGFTFVKNATKLFYPVKASIQSILPIVDEYVVALGNCDEDDATRQEIESIGSDKIKIIDTVWDPEKYPKNTLYAQQTDLAKSACKGDWLFYLQCDELIHENDHDKIINACEKYLKDEDIEGLLFEFRHFWGDFDHYHQAHNWYPREIRIIKNKPDIRSWKDAQSFRKYDAFEDNYEDYLKKKDTHKLNVARIFAWVHHYGFVRPPELMTIKTRNFYKSQNGVEEASKIIQNIPTKFDYGPMDRLSVYKGSHPAPLKEWVTKINWKDQLQTSGSIKPGRFRHKHEKLKYRLLSAIEYGILGGRQIGGFRNYNIIKEEKKSFQ